MDKKWYCYILKTQNSEYNNYTYNGSTNDPIRRLRQHNGEIKGGAKATKGKGPWEIYFLMTGFKSHNEALSCEWRIKHPTGARLRPKKYCGQEGRIKGLNEILHLDKWTSKCSINTDNTYILYVVSEFAKFIDRSKVPNHINIIQVTNIDNIVLNNI